MNLTSVFVRPKGQEEYRLEGQMLQGGLLDWFKEPYSAGARPVRGSRRVCPSCLWVCLCGNCPGDEQDFLSLLMLKGEFPSLSAMVEL